jgi:uncharacterized protein YdaU (DUF1376 family)
MVAFFKHDIAAWRGGTHSLSHEEYRVYHILVEQMMLEEGAIIAHERALAGAANMTVRAFRKVVNALLNLGKVDAIDGRLFNPRVAKELVAIRENRDNAKLGGRNSGKTRRKPEETGKNLPKPTEKPAGDAEIPTEKPSKNNGAGEAPLLRGVEPYREEKSSTLRADALKDADASSDPSKADRELYERGKEVLGKKAGALITQVKTHYGGNIALARAAIEQASTKQDPLEYVGRILNPDPQRALTVINGSRHHVPAPSRSATKLLREQIDDELRKAGREDLRLCGP